MIAHNTLSPYQKNTALLVVLLLHALILYGLIKQTKHLTLRHHSIMVETLVFSSRNNSAQSINLNILKHSAPSKPLISTTPIKEPLSKPPIHAPVTLPTSPAKAAVKESTNTPTQSPTKAPSTSSVKQAPSIDTHYPCPPPNYPASARRNGEEGVVLLSFLINQAGQVELSKVLQSSGSSALDEAALSALSQCRFTPATENGKAIAIRVTIPYVWRLNQ
ncbi:MAG: hypothetical protein B7Z60_08215 [Ferrovum sp. 37-45-19]|nr:MAG: hypothetical protein B7Z65_07155 [Ferrovum sp. 21-44-67]OYV93536.1 MAG: hypothetical protein B7Z60_08215 [Ferrovum sp. 37-45-19]HQT81794.1 TonB family protein [Ferrovaceae bacterium]HQU06904.1 TonB family protein [Ferrovaceae bacterium]